MKIKIQLDKNTTPFEADEMLYKALSAPRNGSAHSSEEKFSDPVMQEMAEKLQEHYKMHFNRMLDDIFNELDKEYE